MIFPHRRRRIITAALSAAMVIISACSSLNRLPPTERVAAQRDAATVLQQISHTNSNLSSFKGIGRVRLWDANAPALSERLAMIGSPPDKLAIAVLAAGRPVIKIAADGRFFYVVDLVDPGGSFRKIRMSDPRLDKLIKIPVSVGDMTAMLAGRTPIRNHHRAFLQQPASGGEAILVLENWWSIIQKVYLSEDLQAVLRFEIFGSDGSLQYQADVSDTQEIHGYRVPARLHLKNDSGTVLQLDIERFVANVPVTSAMFTLRPPGSPTPR